VRLLPGSGRRAATPAEQHALAMLAREGAVPRRQLVNRVAHELYCEQLRRGGWRVEIGFMGDALFRADAERVIAGAEGALWMLYAHSE